MAKLKRGEHQIRVSYFQGPRTQVALSLAVAAPGQEEFRLFNTDDFLSPEGKAEWKVSRPDDLHASSGSRPKRKPGEDIVMAATIRSDGR